VAVGILPRFGGGDPGQGQPQAVISVQGGKEVIGIAGGAQIVGGFGQGGGGAFGQGQAYRDGRGFHFCPP
jgi:hypothetical protein